MSPILSYPPSPRRSSSTITATSISSTQVCCPSGLKCTDVSTNTTMSHRYTATLIAGRVGQGDRGGNVGYFSSIAVLSASPHQTTPAAATPTVLVRHYLPDEDETSVVDYSLTRFPKIRDPESSSPVPSRNESQTTSPTISSITFPTSVSTTPPTTASTTVQPGPTSTSFPQPGSSTTIIVSSVLGGIVFILFIVLAYFLVRYRHGRALKRRNESYDGKVQGYGTNRTQQNSSDGTGGLWNLKPELDSTATRAELEGTPVDH